MANNKKMGVRIIAFTIAAGMIFGAVSAPAFADDTMDGTEGQQVEIEESLQDYLADENYQGEYMVGDQYQQEFPENEEEEMILQEDIEEGCPNKYYTEEYLDREEAVESGSVEADDNDSVGIGESVTDNNTDRESAVESLPVTDEYNDWIHSGESDPDDVRYAEGLWEDWESYEEYSKEYWYTQPFGFCFFDHDSEDEDTRQLNVYEKSLSDHALDEVEEDEDYCDIDEDEDNDEEDNEIDEEDDEEEEEEDSDSDNGWWKILEMKEERLDFTR